MSDHISGPRALAEPIADITDVYAFPSPERQGHLVLVQNTLPFAQPSALFSDGLVYRFRLRPLAAGTASDPASFAVAEEELAFDCVFSDPAAGNGGRHGHLSGERRAWRFRSGRACVCRTALGSVHHGRPGSAEDDSDRRARVHRS